MKTVFKYKFKNRRELKFFLATLGLWGDNRWTLFLLETSKGLMEEQANKDVNQWEIVIARKAIPKKSR